MGSGWASQLPRGYVGMRASPRPPSLPPGALGSAAEPSLWRRGPGGGAGRRGRHEGSGLRHVLRVPHARRVAPAPHVRPTTLVTTFAARPSRPPHPSPRSAVPETPAAWTVGGRAPGPGSRAAGSRGRPRVPTRACALRARQPAKVTRSLCPCVGHTGVIRPRAERMFAFP